jgi:hypothetical protein
MSNTIHNPLSFLLNLLLVKKDLALDNIPLRFLRRLTIGAIVYGSITSYVMTHAIHSTFP